MTPQTVESIRLISIFSIVIPALVYLSKIKRLPRENHIIGFVVIISVLTESIVTIQSRNGHSNAVVTNLYFVLVFVLLCSYFYQVVFKFGNQKYFYSGIILYLVAFLVTSLRKDNHTFQGEMWAIAGLILFVFALIYNNYQLKKPPVFDRNLYSGLFFNAGIMVYFSFNFFLFLIANYILTELSSEVARMAWAFHNVNNIIKNVAFAFGLFYSNARKLNLTEEEIKRIEWRHVQ